jgi:hypothetical protein
MFEGEREERSYLVSRVAGYGGEGVLSSADCRVHVGLDGGGTRAVVGRQFVDCLEMLID